VGALLRRPGDPARLLPEERAHLRNAAPKRLREFAAGRECARAALAQLGIRDAPLLAAEDRIPRWPPGIVGSLTHTGDFCAAIVAPRSRIVALGIDAEIIAQVRSDLWPLVCTPTETAWLDRVPAPQRAATAALLFSAKEAVFKCVYPITRQWMDFSDLAIEVFEADSSCGRFVIVPVGIPRIPDNLRAGLIGRFVIDGPLVITGASIT
jgi:4'-phosphopantetheinyl transferase EntD